MMTRWGASLLLLVLPWAAQAQAVPDRAQLYAPALVTAQRAAWPVAPKPWTLAGLVEQETCITLRHSSCWNPNAQLRTSREQGVGLGQFTRAWTANGALRFDTLSELAAKHPSLRGWGWHNWGDPHYQLTAIVEMNLALWRRIASAPGATVDDQWAFVLASYNGGINGLLQDRRLCSNTRGCDADRWFGHVENTSLKSRTPAPGYGGRSFYQINREHVRNVLTVRREKYRPFWGG